MSLTRNYVLINVTNFRCTVEMQDLLSFIKDWFVTFQTVIDVPTSRDGLVQRVRCLVLVGRLLFYALHNKQGILTIFWSCNYNSKNFEFYETCLHVKIKHLQSF